MESEAPQADAPTPMEGVTEVMEGVTGSEESKTSQETSQESDSGKDSNSSNEINQSTPLEESGDAIHLTDSELSESFNKSSSKDIEEPAQKSDFAAKVTARNHDDQDDVEMSGKDDDEADSSSSGLKISSIVTMANENNESTATDGTNDKSNGDKDNNSQKDVSYHRNIV